MQSASQPDRNGEIHPVATGGKAPDRSDAVARSRTGPARNSPQTLRETLLTLDQLLPRPFDLDLAATRLLELVDEAYPALQSALFVVPGDMAPDGDVSRPLEVAGRRGVLFDEELAIWVEGIARDALAHCQVLGRESNASHLASFLWVPILHRGQHLGVLQLGDDRPRAMAGTRPRELGRLADELGAVLARLLDARRAANEARERDERLEALERECRHLRRECISSRARDFLLHAALRRAETRLGPGREWEGLNAELHELRCGESAAESWVDLGGIVTRACETLECDEGFFALRLEELPPVLCQRMRVEGLFGVLLERAAEAADSDASGWIELRTRAGFAECEIGLESDALVIEGDTWRSWFDDVESREAALDLVRDQGGDLRFEAMPHRLGVTLMLPVDASLR